MIWAVAMSAAALTGAGTYLALSRDALRAVVGVSLVAAGANLAVLSAGRFDGLLPAFVDDGSTVLAASAANPLPQALVLTSLVIGFSLTCFALALVMAIRQQFGTIDSTALRAAEPPPGPDGGPAPPGEER